MLYFSLIFFLVYFLIYLSTDLPIYSFQNRLIPFLGWRSEALVFLGLFYIVVYFVMDAWLLLLCLFQFLNTKPRDWLGKTSPK